MKSLVQQLLGCEWGTRIALPGNKTPCVLRATGRIQIHNHPQDGTFLVQLCDSHMALVMRETDPCESAPATSDVQPDGAGDPGRGPTTSGINTTVGEI